MVDLDSVDVASKLTIKTTNEVVGCRAEFSATHNADKGYAILLRAMEDTAGDSGQVLDIAIDRKAAKMIINYLQTIYEL